MASLSLIGVSKRFGAHAAVAGPPPSLAVTPAVDAKGVPISAEIGTQVTAGTVTWTLIHNARPISPRPNASRKPSRENDVGSAAVPRPAM